MTEKFAVYEACRYGAAVYFDKRISFPCGKLMDCIGNHFFAYALKDRLVDWLDTHDNKPDIICLSNILLLGLARRIKEKLRVPVVCLLQDEDGFLDGLPSPYAEQAWQIIIERAGDVNAFIAVSQYYADVMRQRLNLDPDRVKVAYTGIALEEYDSCQAKSDVPTIGFLSQMSADKGLDTLIDAFILIKKNEKLKNTIKDNRNFISFLL